MTSLWSKLKRLFGNRQIHHSTKPLIEAMKAKDTMLYAQVGILPIKEAWRKWIEVYPEDFPLRGMDIPGPHCIKPRFRVVQQEPEAHQ